MLKHMGYPYATVVGRDTEETARWLRALALRDHWGSVPSIHDSSQLTLILLPAYLTLGL